jgi:hypothetical protein
MNLINKKHPEIIEAKRKSECFLSVMEDRIWISHCAVKRFGLEAGKYLHFLNDGSDWSFFQNDDPDGFLLQLNGKPTSQALVISSRPLIKLILKSTKSKAGTRFYLLKTEIESLGCPVVEIVTNKTYDQLMKAV